MIKFNSSVRMPKRLRLQLSGTPTDLIGMRVSVRLPCYDNKYSNKKQRHFQHLINENITNFMCLLLNHEFIQTSRSNHRSGRKVIFCYIFARFGRNTWYLCDFVYFWVVEWERGWGWGVGHGNASFTCGVR